MTAPARKRPLRLERQLDRSKNEGYDCGRAVAVMEVDYASCGRIRPTTEQIGWRMKRRSGPSNDGDRERALESYDKAARRRGLRGLKVRRYAHSQPLSKLWKLLRLGRPVGVAIDYGEVGDYKGHDFKNKHCWSSRDAELAAQARAAIVAIDAIMPPSTSTTEPTSGVELEATLGALAGCTPEDPELAQKG